VQPTDTLPSVRRVERGALYINRDKRRAWERVVGIAREQDRSEADAAALIERAVGMALVQAGAKVVAQPPAAPTVVEQLVAAFDAEVLPTAERGTCSLPERHGEHHRLHPATARVTCWKCYPPARGAGT
jgi:hypothetical protein